jgi:aminoglycoside 2'-N-acetyltransferase I
VGSIRQVGSSDLTRDEAAALRGLFDEAWAHKEGSFTDEDWRSATGGIHLVVEGGGRIISHASVVDRELETGERTLRTGYVEAVATRPSDQGKGYGSRVMDAVAVLLDERYELGALDTGITGFYERLGWESWRGPTAVRTERGVIRTAEEDGQVMVRRTPSTPAWLDLDAAISCEWRPGDVW